MKKYKKVLAFYKKLLEIISLEEKELPYEIGIAAVELFDEAKDSISLPEFTAEHVNAIHEDFDVREEYAEKAFQDLAPHLRDPEAQALIEEFFTRTGTADGDDLFAHVKNVRPLSDDPYGPAVVTMVVHWYGNLFALLSNLEKNRPSYIHSSFGEKAEVEPS